MKTLIIILSSLFISTDNAIPEINKEAAITVTKNPYAKKENNKIDSYYCIIIGILIYAALGLENKKDE